MRKQFKKILPHERQRLISEGQKELNQLYSLHISDIESDIKGKIDEDLNRELKEAFNEPQIIFYLRAWVPCWLLYRDYPPRLLSHARLGDVKAMGKVLRLDASVIHDSKIGEFLHQARPKGKRATFERLVQAPIEDWAIIHKKVVGNKKSLISIRVDKKDGMSMSPILKPGDIVIIDREDIEIKSTGIYAVKLDDGCTVKRLQVADHQLLLIPENKDPIYKTKVIDLRVHQAPIIGRVIWCSKTL